MNLKNICLVSLTVLCFFMGLSTKSYSQDRYQRGKVIVKFRPEVVNVPVDKASITPDKITILDENLLSLLSNIETTTVDRLIPWSKEEGSIITSPITGAQVVIHNWSEVFVINFNEEQNVNNVLYQMKQLESVVYAERDAIATLDAIPNDTYLNDQWYLLNNVNAKFDIDAVSGWDFSKGDNIIIGTIDTGSDILHEDLANHIWINGGSEVGTPSGNHGTYVAGIAAAVTNNNKGVAGIGWNSWLMPRDAHGLSLDSLIYDILDASVNNGAHILSCSWHTLENYTPLSNAIEDAFNVGSNIVAAMGNNQTPPPYTSYPAAYNNWVIAVGALLKVNHGDTLYARPDMNYGSFIDVTAPGDSLRTTQWKTTDPNNHTRYSWFGATSASTPVVSGVTALIRSIFPYKSNTEVMDIIRNSAILFTGWENDFNHYGHGMVDIFQSILLGYSQQNQTIDYTATYSNSARNQVKGAGYLHEVFASGGEIFYRRSSDGGQHFNVTERITTGNGNNQRACITCYTWTPSEIEFTTLAAVWERKISTYQYEVWYSSSDAQTIDWSSPQKLADVTISSLQSGALPVISSLEYQVANKIGYSSPRSYRRAFKSRFGMLPSKYKEIINSQIYCISEYKHELLEKLWCNVTK
jgi:thermitase